MDPAASSSQVSQYITIMFTIIQISEACKSTRPPIKATSTIAPDEHPLGWQDAIQEHDVVNSEASNPISLQDLSQQYINYIRLACDSLSIMFENLREQGYKDSPDRTQITMQ